MTSITSSVSSAVTSSVSDLLPKITSLASEYSGVTASLATATGKLHLIRLSRSSATLAASIALVSNEQVLQTANETSAIFSANSAVAEASYILSSLYHADNLYGMKPSYGGNMAMAIVMGLFMGIHGVLGFWTKQWWFFTTYIIGCGLEMAGYIGRTLSAHDVVFLDYFLLQIICLTIAPAFLMAGIYFLLAQLVVVYGEDFAIFKPMQYSYIFLSCDIISLAIQAAGGGIAANALTMYESADSGTHIMVAGIAFQVVSMSVFLYFFFHFMTKIRYGRKDQQLMEPLFNEKFTNLRKRPMFRLFPFVVTLGVVFVYVRCVYRVVELAEGWTGYLITHEVYFMILDALMMGLTCLTFLFFHPGVVFSGEHIKIHAGSIKDSFKLKKKNTREVAQAEGSAESKLELMEDRDSTDINVEAEKRTSGDNDVILNSGYDRSG